MGPLARYVKQIRSLCPAGQAGGVPQNMPEAGSLQGAPANAGRASAGVGASLLPDRVTAFDAARGEVLETRFPPDQVSCRV